jgi:hypothetical protein
MVNSKGGNNRSASSGRFVRTGPASTTVTETRGPSGNTGGRYRSASSGRFVTDAYGQRNPGKTTFEK